MDLGMFQLSLNESQRTFIYRKTSDGDTGVIDQIFRNRDYEIAGTEQGKRLVAYHNAISKSQTSLIIDAGANIGASVVWFLSRWPNCFVFGIEPDGENHKILSVNTAGLNCYNFLGAVSNIDGEVALCDPGRSDWGFMTRKIDSEGCQDNSSGKAAIVPSISPDSILQHNATQGLCPFIFKVDIEGGEAALFDGECSWLSKFPLLIIELHDWMLPFSGSSKPFLKAMADNEFDILHRGENIFAFNRTILGNAKFE